MTGKVNVRRDGAQSGAIAEMNAVVGMTTVDDLVIQKIKNDGTVLVSKNTNIGASGVGVDARSLFVYEASASGVGSYPSGDSTILLGHNKSYKTTTH
jgi:hypothetical protein